MPAARERAAQRPGIVQPTVSQEIVRLERELGIRLLDRTSRRVRLTQACERVLAAARETLAAAARGPCGRGGTGGRPASPNGSTGRCVARATANARASRN
ncbi:helix-turn-helix domain-containing protein [Streptomyces phaeofaciens]|uniref:helix-turn-helix domain-containing protein n=1 Tax=Streptomyces phaeofaciens TaxID=68254 RepID=UPI0036AF6011